MTPLKHKVAIAQEETIPNIWNGTMFVDLDWPLNASRGFVSISSASCYLMGSMEGAIRAIRIAKPQIKDG